MSVQPGTYNFTLQRRADYSIALQFKDSNNDAINITGYTVAAQVWDENRTKKYADFTVTYTDRVNGQVSIALTDTQTSVLPDEAYYDVLLTDGSDIKNYYLQGKITVSQGYTS